MIVYLWQAGSAEGIADTSWRARRRAAGSMRRLQEQAGRVEQAQFVIDLPDLGGAAALAADGVRVDALFAFPGH